MRHVRRRLRELGITRVPRRPTADTRAHPAGLTRRQADVLALIADGLTNAEIADELVLSVRTVDTHVGAILDRLGVRSRREAASVARTLDLEDAAALAETFVATPFSQDPRHQRRIDMVADYERSGTPPPLPGSRG